MNPPAVFDYVSEVISVAYIVTYPNNKDNNTNIAFITFIKIIKYICCVTSANPTTISISKETD